MKPDALLAFLLRETPLALGSGGLADFWNATAPLRERFPLSVEQAVATGYAADRLGYAFAGGYEAAMHALVPSLPKDEVACLSVTEEGGNHPRAIATKLERAGDDVVLTGSKRWSTLGPLAGHFIVVAVEGEDELGRPRLKAVTVPRGTPGLTVGEMPTPPFVPEVHHAELTLAGVRVPASAVLPGDGFDDYTKPFRTIEDLHVNAALLGYLLSVATRFSFPESVRERLVALVSAARQVASLSPRAAETHLCLAGLLTEVARFGADTDELWAGVEEGERERWHRDRTLVQVASKARASRRERAWRDVSREGEP